jgi:hypothetical protein
MSEPKTTTLNEIRKFNPCKDGWEKLLKFLNKTKADDEPLLMSTILKSNGLSDAIWCLRAFHVDHRQSVIEFACDCAESVLPIWEEWAKVHALEKLEAPRQAIDAARNGSRAAAAYAAADAAAYAAADAAAAEAAHAAYAAADAAAYAAADAAAYAAYAAADAAAYAAAADAAAEAAHAAYAAAAGRACAHAAADAAAVADDAAADAEKVMQAKVLIKHFG